MDRTCLRSNEGRCRFCQSADSDLIAQQMSNDFPYTYNLKGCLNLTDINRIEGNIQYLSDRLDELHYPPGTSCKVWNEVVCQLSETFAESCLMSTLSSQPIISKTISDSSRQHRILHGHQYYRRKSIQNQTASRLMVEGFQSGMFNPGDEDATYQEVKAVWRMYQEKSKTVAIGDNCFYMRNWRMGALCYPRPTPLRRQERHQQGSAPTH